MREASIRWKGRQILQLFFVTKIRVSFFSLLKSYKSSCLQLFCTGTAYFSTSFLTDLSFQSLEKLQQQSSKHSIIRQFGGCSVGRGKGGSLVALRRRATSQGIWDWLWFSCGITHCSKELISVFQQFFASIGKIFIWRGYWALGNYSVGFRHVA